MGALYMECSSKEMTGVHDIFETAINTVVAEQEGLLEPPSTAGSGRVGKKSESATNYTSSSAGGANGASNSQNKAPLLAPSKKKKRSGCKIL